MPIEIAVELYTTGLYHIVHVEKVTFRSNEAVAEEMPGVRNASI